MPRPTTKKELLALSKANYNKLIYFIESFDETDHNKEFPESYLNRNNTDVLAHLHHWHLLVLGCYAVGMSGGIPEMPS
ncbi:MAG: hypothetical protein ACJART_002300 [Maribacter sp.]|jgi:hypothetical protein|tara:strand:- start:307 stop:540 length:234 start_codon:yes stop_codon:yes gene_type:complete